MFPSTSKNGACTNRARLGLQTLESREVPAFVDLSTAGASAVVNGAIVRQVDAAPASQFNTFLRIQDCFVERGYNTDAADFQFDVVGDHTTTHALKLADVPLVTVGGVAYRQFILDVNEPTWLPRISLEELRFFVADTGDLSGYRTWSNTLAGRRAVWSLDGPCNVSVKLNANLNTGTGKGDMEILVPDSVFGGATYVYLYSRFGPLYWTNGGAEEWGVRPSPVSAPGTLSGYVYWDANNNGVREPNGSIANPVPEFGLGGVAVRLQGRNELGESVDMTVLTDANGHYEFTGLQPGVYSVTKLADPPDFMDGINTPGDPLNGQVQESNSDPTVPDMIFDIHLAAGQGLSDYNFGELDILPPI